MLVPLFVSSAYRVVNRLLLQHEIIPRRRQRARGRDFLRLCLRHFDQRRRANLVSGLRRLNRLLRRRQLRRRRRQLLLRRAKIEIGSPYVECDRLSLLRHLQLRVRLCDLGPLLRGTRAASIEQRNGNSDANAPSSPLIELVRIRKAAAGAPSGAAWLVGTIWRLEDLAGTGVLNSAEATLEFPSEGRVAGKASCNRFTFGPQALTRMACADAVMRQERAYLEALHGAREFRVEGPFLYIYGANRDKPLRFIRG